MAVPYTFGSATASIPLSQLDSNFATTITLGNTAIQLGNTVTTLNNMTLANVTVSSGTVTLPAQQANAVVYLNSSNVVTANASVLSVVSGNLGINNSNPSYRIDAQTSATGTSSGDNTIALFASLASGRDVNIRFGDSVNASSRIGYLSGNMYFWTNGAERARFNTSGNLQFITADAGIVFNKTGALNNQVLNDYEYGTWTPSIGAVGGSNFTMSEQNGSYVKVGKMVTVIGILSWTSKGSASSSAGIYIKNLPFLSNSDGVNTRMVGTYGIMPATNTNWYNIWLYGGGNDTNIQISGKNSLTGQSTDLLVSDISSSTTTRFSITYYTD